MDSSNHDDREEETANMNPKNTNLVAAGESLTMDNRSASSSHSADGTAQLASQRRRQLSPSRTTALSQRRLKDVLDKDPLPAKTVPSDEPLVGVVKLQRDAPVAASTAGGVVVADKHLRRPLGLKRGAAPSSRDVSPTRDASPTRPAPTLAAASGLSRRHMQTSAHSLNVSTVATLPPAASLIVDKRRQHPHHHLAAHRIVEEVHVDDVSSVSLHVEDHLALDAQQPGAQAVAGPPSSDKTDRATKPPGAVAVRGRPMPADKESKSPAISAADHETKADKTAAAELVLSADDDESEHQGAARRPRERRGQISSASPSTASVALERGNDKARRTVEQMEHSVARRQHTANHRDDTDDKILSKNNADPTTSTSNVTDDVQTSSLLLAPPPDLNHRHDNAMPGAFRGGGTEQSSVLVDGDEEQQLPPSEHLIEAILVQERSEALIVPAVTMEPDEHDHPDDKKPIYRHKQFYLVVGGVLCCVLVVVVVVVVSVLASVNTTALHESLESGENHETVEEGVNVQPAGPPMSPLYHDYVQILSAIDTSHLVEQLGSKSNEALNWMLYRDPNPIAPTGFNARRIAQRFLMTLFYLVASDRQDWLGCNPPANVTDTECMHMILGQQNSDGGGGGSGYPTNAGNATSPSGNATLGNDTLASGANPPKRRQLVYTHVLSHRWLSSAPECDWAGVNCTDSGWVESIQLEYYNMKGHLMAELGELQSLAELSLEGNSLRGSLPGETIGLLTALVKLDVKDNGFTGTILTELCNITALEQLLISDNEFTGTIPPCLGSLPNLRELEIGNIQQLSGPIPSELGNLSLLDTLVINNSILTGTVPSAFCERPMDKLMVDCNELECACCTDCG